MNKSFQCKLNNHEVLNLYNDRYYTKKINYCLIELKLVMMMLPVANVKLVTAILVQKLFYLIVSPTQNRKEDKHQ